MGFCRAFTILVTPLPNPDHTCVPVLHFPDNIWLEGWAITPFNPWAQEVTCQDVLFSGHTVAITLPMVLYFRNTRYSPWFEWQIRRDAWSPVILTNMMGCAVVLVGYFCIIASYFHYTVDVLVGFLLTNLVVLTYHQSIKVAALSKSDRFFVYSFMRWFEAHALDLRFIRWELKSSLLE